MSAGSLEVGVESLTARLTMTLHVPGRSEPDVLVFNRE
jgi:hypothetical protein